MINTFNVKRRKQATRWLQVACVISVLAVGMVGNAADALAQVQGTAVGNGRTNAKQTVGSVLRSVQAEIKRLSTTVEGMARTNSATRVGQSRNAANLITLLEKLDGQMRAQIGAIEELNNRVEVLRRDVLALQALAQTQNRSSVLAPSGNNARDTLAADLPKPKPPLRAKDTAEPVPEDPLDRAEYYLNANDLEQASSVLKSAIAGDNNALAVEARYLMGEVQFEQKLYKQAAGSLLVALTRADKSSRKMQGLFTLARSLKELGQVDQACATLRELMTRDSSGGNSDLFVAAQNGLKSWNCSA